MRTLALRGSVLGESRGGGTPPFASSLIEPAKHQF